MSTDNTERPNYYAQIPANVRYSEDVTANAKLLYAEITALCNKTGTCWASNQYFADLYKVKINAVSNWVKQLVDAGFITTKINKAAGNRRYLRLAFVDPITQKDNSYDPKRGVNNNKTNNNSIVDLNSQLLLLVNKITHRSFRTLPDRGVKKTLDAFTLDEIGRALTALVNDDWHKERIKKFKIDYLIRATTIDRFLGVAPDKIQTQDELLKEYVDKSEAQRLKDLREHPAQ